jgi:hypothetical protein
MKTFVTFGQSHAHRVNNETFDCNCVAVIHHGATEDGRALAFDLFGGRFCFEYSEEEFDMSTMAYFPRGFIDANEPILQRTCNCGAYLKDGDLHFCQDCKNRQEPSQYNLSGGY